MKQMLMDILFGAPERKPRKCMVGAVIEFGGGTTNNRPAEGYGNGYASLRIDEGQIHRLTFGPMSSKAAAIFTMVAAINQGRAGGATALVLCGDGKIALGWAERVAEPVACEKASGAMSQANAGEHRRTTQKSGRNWKCGNKVAITKQISRGIRPLMKPKLKQRREDVSFKLERSLFEEKYFPRM